MTINEWLQSGRDYATGVQLYEQFGTNRTLKGTFKRGDKNKWCVDKLAYELGKLSHVANEPALSDADDVVLAGPIAEVSAESGERERVRLDEGKVLQLAEWYIEDGLLEEAKAREANPIPENAPAAVQALENEWKALYKRAATLHQQLQYAESDEKRAEMCAEIVDTFEQGIDPIWSHLDEYKRTGKLPEEPKKSLLDKAKEMVLGKKPFAEMTPIELMKEQGNLRSRISKNKDKSKRQKDVDAWRAELKEVEALIKENEG